jgi:hypothetical protein
MRRGNLTGRLAAGLTAAALALAGCGASDGPGPDNALAPAACPPMDQLAPHLIGHLRAGDLPGLKHVLGEEISPDELAVLLDGGIRLIKGLTHEELLGLLRLADNRKLLALLPLVVELLQYVDGDPANPASFRTDVLDEARRLVDRCDWAQTFTAIQDLLGSPDLPTLLGSIAAALQTPTVQALLHGGASGAIDKDGFLLLVCTLLNAIAQPDFQFTRDFVTPLQAFNDYLHLDQPPLSTLLQALERMLAPDQPLFPSLQNVLVCGLDQVGMCARDADGQAQSALVGLLYDLFVSDTARFDDLLAVASDAAADPNITATLAPLRRVLGAVADDADLRAAFVRLLQHLLEPDNARRVLPEVALLLQDDATAEVLHIASALIDGCAPADMEAGP